MRQSSSAKRLIGSSLVKEAALLEKKGVSISKAGFENPGDEFWANHDLPFYDLPDKIVTHVSTKAWREMTEEVC